MAINCINICIVNKEKKILFLITLKLKSIKLSIGPVLFVSINKILRNNQLYVML